MKNLILESIVSDGTKFSQDAGTLAGINEGTIENCKVINAESTSEYRAGGLVASNLGGRIINCTVTGNITGCIVGGIAGINTGIIEKCSVNASVRGTEIAGGIVGLSSNDYVDLNSTDNVDLSSKNKNEIRNCFSAGAAAARLTGGIVGSSHATYIHHCYSVCALPEESKSAGGIVGLNQGIVSDCIAANECINGSRCVVFNLNLSHGFLIRFVEPSRVGMIDGASDEDKIPQNCYAWEGIKTNKLKFNRKNAQTVSSEEIWNMFPNGVWKSWDAEIWEPGQNGLPVLK